MKNTNRKVNVTALSAMFFLIIGGIITFLGMNFHIKNTEPELKVQVEMKNIAQISAYEGILSLNDDRYKIIDYSSNTITVRGEKYDCIAYFSELNGELESSEFLNNMSFTSKLAIISAGSIVGFFIGVLIGSIIKKIRSK